MTHKHGARHDEPDSRDYSVPTDATEIRTAVDLRGSFSEIYDQGDINSCSAQALAAVVWYLSHEQISRLWLYYHERELEHTENTDAGAMLRSGLKVLRKGVPLESEYAYDTSKVLDKPPAERHAESLLAYYKLTQPDEIRRSLSQGYPVVILLEITESFERSEKLVPTDPVVGYHFVVIVGYNPDGVLIRNSWGDEWGDHGYAWIDWDYIAQRSGSWWSLRRMEA